LENLLPSTLSTDSESPLVLAIDDTFSMGDAPGIFFGKAAYFDVEGKSYLGQNRAVSFATIGDVFSDKFPLQLSQFVNGLEIKKKLESFIHERGGGPGLKESYETCALYYARNVSMPKVTQKPIFIFMGDEGMYDKIDKATAKKYAKVNLEKEITSKQVMDELKEKFAVYLIRRPYRTPLEDCTAENRVIHSQWASMLGEDHIAVLPEAERMLDVIFGILAKERQKIDYFRGEIEDRQIESVKPEERGAGVKKVEVAYEALSSIFGKKYKVDSKWKK
jgi:hypothetical protein